MKYSIYIFQYILLIRTLKNGNSFKKIAAISDRHGLKQGLKNKF